MEGADPGLCAWPGLRGGSPCDLFIPPQYSFALSPEYVVAFCIFLALCLLLSEFGAGAVLAERALRTSEERIRVSEARFRTLVDHATDAFYLSDEQSRII
jgi:PAS domain-containing protein